MVRDPDGIEGPAGDTDGLGLLDVETVLTGDKRLVEVDATDAISGARVTGYEIHMGRTTGPGLSRPWLRPDGVAEGAVSADGRVMGSYLHGLFGSDGFRGHWLVAMGATASAMDHAARLDRALDALADEIEADLDLDALLAMAR
jgi:adenosylcobyric acid synthase